MSRIDVYIHVDQDECQNDPCEQVCINNEGSFTCSCNTGYELQEDRSSCEGPYV